jgi:hypothetical protein
MVVASFKVISRMERLKKQRQNGLDEQYLTSIKGVPGLGRCHILPESLQSFSRVLLLYVR